MLDANVRFLGEAEVRRIFDNLPEAIEVSIRDIATTLRNLVIGQTPVGIRPNSPRMKQSWSDVERTATGFAFSNPKDYASVLEEGRYPGVGPRTVATEGGIFSRQAPGGIIGPLLEDQARIESIIVGIAQALEQQMSRL